MLPGDEGSLQRGDEGVQGVGGPRVLVRNAGCCESEDPLN